MQRLRWTASFATPPTPELVAVRAKRAKPRAEDAFAGRVSVWPCCIASVVAGLNRLVEFASHLRMRQPKLIICPRSDLAVQPGQRFLARKKDDMAATPWPIVACCTSSMVTGRWKRQCVFWPERRTTWRRRPDQTSQRAAMTWPSSLAASRAPDAPCDNADRATALSRSLQRGGLRGRWTSSGGQYALHSTQHTASTQLTVHRAQSTQHTAHSTQYTVHSTQYSTQYTIHRHSAMRNSTQQK